MRITWYGHAAFLIETQGLRIILDPYRSPDSGGYEPIAEPADLVVVSHENDRYHSHLGQIVPPFEVVRALELPPEGKVFRGIRFESVHVFETAERLPEDEVTIVHFRAEGPARRFPGRPGPSALRDRAGAAARRRHRPGGRRRPADDRLSRHPRPARCHRAADRRSHALQDAQDQPQHPAAGTVSGVLPASGRATGDSSIEITRATLPVERTIVVLEHA